MLQRRAGQRLTIGCQRRDVHRNPAVRPGVEGRWIAVMIDQLPCDFIQREIHSRVIGLDGGENVVAGIEVRGRRLDVIGSACLRGEPDPRIAGAASVIDRRVRIVVHAQDCSIRVPDPQQRIEDAVITESVKPEFIGLTRREIDCVPVVILRRFDRSVERDTCIEDAGRGCGIARIPGFRGRAEAAGRDAAGQAGLVERRAGRVQRFAWNTDTARRARDVRAQGTHDVSPRLKCRSIMASARAGDGLSSLSPGWTTKPHDASTRSPVVSGISFDEVPDLRRFFRKAPVF